MSITTSAPTAPLHPLIYPLGNYHRLITHAMPKGFCAKVGSLVLRLIALVLAPAIYPALLTLALFGLIVNCCKVRAKVAPKPVEEPVKPETASKLPKNPKVKKKPKAKKSVGTESQPASPSIKGGVERANEVRSSLKKDLVVTTAVQRENIEQIVCLENSLNTLKGDKQLKRAALIEIRKALLSVSWKGLGKTGQSAINEQIDKTYKNKEQFNILVTQLVEKYCPENKTA